MACDIERFKRFFHGMLNTGVYLAPRRSSRVRIDAHSDADLAATLGAARRVFATLK